MGMLARSATEKLLKVLDTVEKGSLELTTPDGKIRTFGGKKPGINAQLVMKDWRVISNLALKGDTGFARDYQDGHWETCNLQDLLSFGMMNDDSMKNFVFGNPAFRFMSQLSYFLKSNSLKGSRRNIHEHYDLGNEFYKLWLDEGMTYSSALYKDENESLEQAQNNKYDALLDRLSAGSGEILEIGCGWGGFAERSLSKKDFSIKGITLSDEQHQYAKNRLGNKAHVALEDYRHQTGQFDHIVSIEMFEAVGEKYWPVYFDKIAALLKKGGKAVIQTITIADHRFDQYRKGSDVIRSAIFPGGMLPSPSRFRQQAQKSGLRVSDEFHFGQDYAKTLGIWLGNFDRKIDEMQAIGFDDKFIRLWRFYLAACIAGFQTERTSVMHIELEHDN